MSAIALIQTPDKTYLYSDGRAIMFDGAKVDNQKKIDKLGDHTALISVGRWYEGNVEHIISEIHRQELSQARRIANLAAEIMKHQLSDMPYEDPERPDGQASTYLMVLGYEKGFPVHFLIDARKDFAVEQIPVRNTIFLTAMIYGNWNQKESSYGRYLREALKPRIDMGQAGYQAFQRYIEDYMHTGKVNKNIYQETIKRENKGHIIEQV